ncbi:AraC family transcriptional regulator [Brucella grignonensis]|uniref:AraC family transcriptional regulator n=1 Tax=Brucella grignonensis TaxID=94627 RepID=UPI000B97E486|nr:helix-turn-helix transcriptional regulator [Brucella grignonensis]
MNWTSIATPQNLAPPEPVTVRAQTIPPRHYFPRHSHPWNQLVYAISGVLTVVTDAESFAITPDHAVWLPTGLAHHVGSVLGAEFRSLWIAEEAAEILPRTFSVFSVSPLLKALIVEAAAIEGKADQDGYADRVTSLILDQLQRARSVAAALPWPPDPVLMKLCEELYLNPSDRRGPEELADTIKVSPRTLARRFEANLGMSLRSWRRRLRLFRSIELLGGGLGVTQVAMELGYSSTSAFVYAFRTQMGCSPQAYMRRRKPE